MTELEQLIEQRRELDRRIREIREQNITCGSVKLYRRHYTGCHPDDWCLAVKTDIHSEFRPVVWRTISADTDREKVVRQLPGIIRDMNELQRRLRQGATDDGETR